MTRWPTLARAGLTALPTAATMPHGSCPAIVGVLGAASPPVSPPAFGRRYWCKSLPHMPEAFISMTTSSGPGVGSGKFISSSSRPPVNTTPRIAFPPWLVTGDASMSFPQRIRNRGPNTMRVLVIYAHPLADSFAAALHRAVVATLTRAGHEVDDCDLYALGFDPVMKPPERRAHNTPNPDLSAVEHHVERLRAADALGR